MSPTLITQAPAQQFLSRCLRSVLVERTGRGIVWTGRHHRGAPTLGYSTPSGPLGSILFDLRSSLLSLGRVEASFTLLSLTRSLHPSPLHHVHTRCRSQRCQRCCQYRHDNLNNCLPTFFLHSLLMVND